MAEEFDLNEDWDADLASDEEITTDDPADVSFDRMVTAPPLDLIPIAKALESFPSMSPLERTIITSIQELHQTHGDADAQLADRLADIEGTLRTFFLELKKSPGSVLLGVLATMNDEEQISAIKKIIPLLRARKERCWNNISQREEDESGRII